MYIVLVKNKVKPEYKKVYLETSKKFSNDMKNIKGCIDAQVLLSDTNPDMIVNLEMWESKEIYELYDGSVFMKYKKDLKKGFLGNTTEIYFA